MLRRLLKISIVLLLLALAAPLAVHLPPVRGLVEDRASQALGREVHIGSISAYWFRTITLEDVRVESPSGFDAPLATVSRIEADVDMLALAGGTLDADVVVHRPHVRIERRDGRSNLERTVRADDRDDTSSSDRSSREAADAGENRIRFEVRDGAFEMSLDGEVTKLEDVALVAALDDRAVTLAAQLGADLSSEASGTLSEDGDALVLDGGVIDGGDAFTLRLTTPWTITLGDAPTARGDARLDSNLGVLGRSAPIFRRLRGGVLAANVRGLDTDRLGFSASAGVDGLYVEADDRPVREARIVAQARWRQLDADTDLLEVFQLESGFIRTKEASTTTPFALYREHGRFRLDGPIGLRADLDGLSRLAPELLGLEPGERITGIVEVDGRAEGDASRPHVTATVRGRGIVYPKRLARHTRAASFDADVEAEGDRATVDLTTSLDAVRPWLGLDPLIMLGGRLAAKLELSQVDDVTTITGRTTATDVVWRRASDRVVRERQITADVDLQLASDGGRDIARTLVVRLTGLALDLSGSSVATGTDDPDLTLEARITGDAAALAPTLAEALGPDYDDLAGEGAISGTASVSGSLSHGARDLVLDAALELGTWRTGGLALANTTLGLRHGRSDAELESTLRSTVNGGPTSAVLALDLSREQSTPWKLAIRSEHVDTSTLLLDRGLGAYLPFVVPSVIPADSDVPVLSGLLDVEADLAARGFMDPLLSESLVGRATVAMREGKIKDSTLFGKGRGGLDGVTKLIAVAVPEIRDTLVRASKAVVFSTVDSKLRVIGGIVHVDEAALVGEHLRIGMQGTVTFEERLDLDARVQPQGRNQKRLGKFLKDGVIPLRIKGTLDKPKVDPAFDGKAFAADGLLGRLKDLIK